MELWGGHPSRGGRRASAQAGWFAGEMSPPGQLAFSSSPTFCPFLTYFRWRRAAAKGRTHFLRGGPRSAAPRLPGAFLVTQAVGRVHSGHPHGLPRVRLLVHTVLRPRVCGGERALRAELGCLGLSTCEMGERQPPAAVAGAPARAARPV